MINAICPGPIDTPMLRSSNIAPDWVEKERDIPLARLGLPEEIGALWNAIDRTGTDHVRVIFRTAGAESPLESAELAPLRQIWVRDEERSAEGFEQDRSGIYGGFHCYVRR